MNTIIIIEFLVISLLHLLNVHIILNFEFNIIQFKPLTLLFINLYMAFAFLFVFTELYYFDNNIRIIIFIAYYTSLIISSLLLNQRQKYMTTIYTTLLYLSIDSILQSGVFLCTENLFSHYDKRFVMRIISVLSNILILLFLSSKRSSKRISQTIISSNIISRQTYILILIALIISGSLLENQLIDINETDFILQIKTTKILTAICIPMLILIIISLLFNCITKSYYKNASSLLEKQINMQLDYYEKLEKKNKELREFRHDYKNHMLCLQALINSNELEEASQYIQKLTNRSYYETSEYFTGNKIADAILTDKSAAAKNIGAEINFQGEIFDGISASDICVILSNALDNAIEACGQISISGKSINVSCIFSRNVQIISISNPVISDTKIRNGFIETTKQDKSSHGFGLYNIKKTVDKYNGDFNIKCENGIFTLEIGFNIADSNIKNTQNATVVYK